MTLLELKSTSNNFPGFNCPLNATFSSGTSITPTSDEKTIKLSLVIV